MLTEKLYKRVLLDPPQHDESLDNLFIVSGYATSAMANRHLNKSASVNVNLIYGMTARDGISLSNHQGFCKLVANDFPGRFDCSYTKKIPVHSKVYVWCAGTTPRIAFCGSANYTQTALYLTRQKEVFVDCNAQQAFAYYQSLTGDAVSCVAHNALATIPTYVSNKQNVAVAHVGQKLNYAGLRHATVSLLTQKGTVGGRSGLNWGQRPEVGRNPNQAYIALPASVSKTDFFPPRPTRFTILTDDGKTLVCARAQDASKAIHTSQDNSLMGVYFRARLGLKSGAPVTLNDLQNYGRTNIDFYKIDDETYYMDFS